MMKLAIQPIKSNGDLFSLLKIGKVKCLQTVHNILTVEKQIFQKKY